MYRPSQTPHPTLSSARIASQNKFPTERKKLKATERTKTPAETENPRTPGSSASNPGEDCTSFNTRIKPDEAVDSTREDDSSRPTPTNKYQFSTIQYNTIP